MKRFLFIIATAGLMVGMNAEGHPYYKVQCYDVNDKLVSCDDVAVAKTKKHTHVYKSNKAKIAKAKKAADALAQKNAREKAIALRELAKQNEELRAEMQALRKANLLAAAKTEEKPADTAQLATTTTVQLPVAPTSTTQIATDVEEKDEVKFGGGITDEVTQGFKEGDLFKNELDLAFDYIPTKHLTVEIEQDMYWNWTTGADSNRGFKFDDLTLMLAYGDIYHTEDKLGQLDGHVKLSLPTTQKSRDFGKVLGIEFKAKWKQMVNNSKGFVKFEAAVTPVINRYSTAPIGSGNGETTMANGLPWEKLAPNTRFKTGFKTVFNHKLVGALSFETSAAINSAYLFADEVQNDDGTVITVQPAAWSNTLELVLPKFIYTVSDAVSIATKLVTSTSFDEFKLFNTDKTFGNSDFGVYFSLSYSI